MPVYAQHSRLSPQDQKTLHEYELTEGKIDKLMAVGKKMKEYAEAHPQVREKSGFMGGDTLDDSVKSVEAKPEMVAIMKSEGLQPREFVLGMMSLISAGMWAEMSKSYPDAKMPPEINPKNVKLLQEHPEILQRWQAAWNDRRGK
jgi:hypothetical protein